MEAIGYVGRIVAAQETPNWTRGPFILQAVLLLVAPALFAATIYMLLARIVILVNGEPYVMIPVSWLTTVFVTGDVLSFLLQASGKHPLSIFQSMAQKLTMSGGGMMAGNTAELMKLGKNIILIGLCVQLAVFGFFIFVATSFQLKMHGVPTMQSMDSTIPWHKHM